MASSQSCQLECGSQGEPLIIWGKTSCSVVYENSQSSFRARGSQSSRFSIRSPFGLESVPAHGLQRNLIKFTIAMEVTVGNEQLRPTGIGIVGDVPWGTHFFL